MDSFIQIFYQKIALFLKLFHSEMPKYNCLYNGIWVFPFLCLWEYPKSHFSQSKNTQIPHLSLQDPLHAEDSCRALTATLCINTNVMPM